MMVGGIGVGGCGGGVCCAQEAWKRKVPRKSVGAVMSSSRSRKGCVPE